MQRTRLGDKGVLVSGYNIMQRISIGSVTIITYCPCKRKYISFFLSALEMVLRDLQRGPTEEYVRKRGNFWKMTYHASNRVVEAFYVALLNRNHNVERMTLLKRDIVPQQVACMASGSPRDLRDWVVLSNVLQLTEFFKELMKKYAHSRQVSVVTEAFYDSLVNGDIYRANVRS